VDDASLSIEPGELFFLLGPSGCGKTTLLRMIAGFIEPSSGSIAFNGRHMIGVPAEKRNTGMVFQSYALWPHMTVEGNVAFGLTVRRVPAAERARRVAEALALVHMQDYARRTPNQLSGGQQQRVALARALVVRPDVLLLDEPLSNLDARLRVQLRSEIRRICKASGITTVYVTHDQKEALSMADRAAILNAGKLVQIGPPAELYRRPATRFAAEFLGETNFVPATRLEHRDGHVVVETPLGRLRSAHAVPADAASSLLCSLRPEAFRISSGGRGAENTIRARIIDSVYLGELAHHEVEAQGGTRFHIAQLNPRAALGADLTLSVDPEDVVVLRS
jgi:iron(III) transport system ATP-binding protein